MAAASDTVAGDRVTIAVSDLRDRFVLWRYSQRGDLRRPHPDRTPPVVQRWLSLRPDRGTVVELCCGYGATARSLAREGFSVFAYDGSPPVVEEARRRTPDGAGIVWGERRLNEGIPAENNTVVAVVCLMGPHHTRDQRALMAEIRRVLRPGGYFVTAVRDARHSYPKKTSTVRWLWRRVTKSILIYPLTEEGLRRLLDEAGFDVLDLRKDDRRSLDCIARLRAIGSFNEAG
jgi:SAM-dependent methyltransferase